MVVVAIIGILAAIAIPKFADLVRKSGEGAGKGNLGAIRSALSIHYGDREGSYPYHPVALTAHGRYMAALPLAKTPSYHPDSDKVTLVASAAGLSDAGGWAYLADPASPDYGTVYVNCTHTDTKGSVWSAY
jgi:type II secretory pathway pseudopilin PulG